MAKAAVVIYLFLSFIGLESLHAGMKGEYTIDPSYTTKGRSFQSFADFINVLSFGIDSSVNVNVFGTHNGLQIIKTPDGMSSGKRLSITGKNAVVNGGFRIDTSNYVTIQHFVIFPSASWGYGVRTQGACHYLNVKYCLFTGPGPPSFGRYGIYNPHGSDSLEIIGNRFYGLSYPVYSRGTTAKPCNSIVLINNIISGNRYYPLYLYSYNGIKLRHNTIVANAGYYSYMSSPAKTSGHEMSNNIFSGSAGAAYGFYWYRGKLDSAYNNLYNFLKTTRFSSAPMSGIVFDRFSPSKSIVIVERRAFPWASDVAAIFPVPSRKGSPSKDPFSPVMAACIVKLVFAQVPKYENRVVFKKL